MNKGYTEPLYNLPLFQALPSTWMESGGKLCSRSASSDLWLPFTPRTRGTISPTSSVLDRVMTFAIRSSSVMIEINAAQLEQYRFPNRAYSSLKRGCRPEAEARVELGFRFRMFWSRETTGPRPSIPLTLTGSLGLATDEKASENLFEASRCRVSNTSELLPEPDTPVTTVSPSENRASISRKLFSPEPITFMVITGVYTKMVEGFNQRKGLDTLIFKESSRFEQTNITLWEQRKHPLARESLSIHACQYLIISFCTD